MTTNNNHYQEGVVFGSCNDVPLELVILHLKKIGGVLKNETESDVA